MKQHKTPVYVVNKHHKPLMPTYRFGHVRKLIKEGKAVPISKNPFTIRLKYETPDIVQALYGGIDTGRENVGLGVSKEDGEGIYLSDVRTNNKSVKKNMADRAGYRRARRRHDRQNKQRKAVKDGTAIQNGDDDTVRTKHSCKSVKVSYPGADEAVTHKVIRGKEGKFNNRKRSDDWLTPSAWQLIRTTMNSVQNMCSIMPISHLSIERVAFDFQRMENTSIRAWQYGKGPLYGFQSYKDYIYAEQDGKCLLCGKPITQYHHIVPQKTGKYDNVNNIAGLCNDCHCRAHGDEVAQEQLLELREGAMQRYKVGLLNSVMPMLIELLSDYCEKNGITLTITEGKDTAETRDRYDIPKDHSTDGYAISLYGRKHIVKPSIPENVFIQRRFKKKSNNNISKIGKREYYFNGRLVAVNRHKAMDQKADSLEEHMTKYAESHDKTECDRHFHKLEIRPAKRVYTYHKTGLRVTAHPGDLVSYTKVNKTYGNTKHNVVVAVSARADSEGGHIEYADGKSFKSIYCKPIGSGSVQYVDVKPIDTIIDEIEKSDLAKNAA